MNTPFPMPIPGDPAIPAAVILDKDGPLTMHAMNAPVNILLVDDEARNLDVLESVLQAPDYRLVRAQSADEALRALVSDTFAVILLDIRLPDMSGLELAQLIKKRKKTEHLPIIFLTAYYQEDEHVMQGYGAGAVDYLSKPCHPAILRSKVAAFVDLFRTSRILAAEIETRRAAEQRVHERTLEAEARAAQLRRLAGELATSEERARRKLAQVLHDQLQQLLVAAKMRVNLVNGQVAHPSHRDMLGQVEELLDQAIGESRSLTAELSPPVVYDAGLAAGLAWLARWMQEKHNFNVGLDLAGPSQALPQGLQIFLFQTARELLFNAVKHAGVPAARLAVRMENSLVVVEVEDTGVGFDPLRLAGENQGFGLFSVRERVELLGGTMDVRSSPGQGTRITLRLPVEQARAPEFHSPGLAPSAAVTVRDSAAPLHRFRSQPASASSPLRVLLVDDHKILRQGLATMLEMQEGVELVGQAGDGHEALALARTLHPDVVIMDITMPNMGGIEATRCLAAELPQIKVIGLSMHEEEDIAHALRQAGAVAFVSKGGPMAELVAAIRACATPAVTTTQIAN